MGPRGRHYKIKLVSGRVLGPLDIERVRALIQKNQIVGKETAREYPDGEWKDINQISELATLVVAHAAGKLDQKEIEEGSSTRLGAETVLLPGSTQVLPGTTEPNSFGTLPELQAITEGGAQIPESRPQEPTAPNVEIPPEVSETKTQSRSVVIEPAPPPTSDPVEEAPPPRTRESAKRVKTQKVPKQKATESLPAVKASPFKLAASPIGVRDKVSDAETVVFQRDADSIAGVGLPGKRKPRLWDRVKGLLAAVALGVAGYELLLEEPVKPVRVWTPIRPSMPMVMEKTDPPRSVQIYGQAMASYMQDTVVGYRAAAEKLRLAAGLDPSNVKALAMLASSYLNLIDSSNKDENYFTVISRLIEMSRAKKVDLPETVIADVEYYITAHKFEAAQSRIVEYTKTHQNFDAVMFYYIAMAFYYRGDPATAARYLNQYPENKAFGPKFFYFRGQVAEDLGDQNAALQEYKKALKMSGSHMKSRLRIAQIFQQRGRLQDAGPLLQTLIQHQNLLAPKDLAQAYFLHAQLSEAGQKWDIALGDMERAVKLDRENSNYILELYTLRAKLGDKVASMKADARMYFFLGEGEKLLHQGRYQEALTQFLSARQANDRSPLPPIKIGDMFSRMHELGNAKINYKLATERAPQNIDVWSKYIHILIESYEWDEAREAMDRFRKLPVPQGAIDKAAADMYQKQGMYVEARTYYRKAMARDTIDPSVYIAYAKNLMSTGNYKEAPFFFALAQRFDPLNIDALIGTANCVAATDSIDRGISMLQDELQRNTGSKAELFAAIAEFQMQKGDWAQAQQSIDSARAANPDYAQPWKLQAQIYLNREGIDKTALDKALLAYQSYSERNPSDPSGYLERYKIFAKKTQYEKAGEELDKIYVVLPKFPNLHFYKGILYSTMGNYKVAIEEYQRELKNSPNHVQALVALGRALVELRSPQEALSYLNKAMQLSPRGAEAKQEAAWANYMLKNYPGAIALFRAALAYDNANPIIYKRLGLVYRDSGDLASAGQAFKKYLEMEPDAPDKAEFERYR